MGLFSRLKKAFSLPESDDAQTTSAASEAPATTSQANAPVSDDRAPSSQQPARSEGATTESTATPVSSTAVSEATSTADEPATVKSAATSEAPADSTAAVSAQSGSQASLQSATVSEAPLTASAMVAQSLAALSASAAQVSQAAASDVALATKSDAVVEGNAMSESVASTAPAVKSSATTATESAAPTVNAAADSESAEPELTEAERYDEGLKKSRKTFGDRINAFLANFRHVDEAFFDDLEDTLIESDVGYETAMRISDELRDEVKLKNAKSKKEISSVIVEKLVDMYGEAGEGEDNSIHMAKSGPTVILFVGSMVLVRPLQSVRWRTCTSSKARRSCWRLVIRLELVQSSSCKSGGNETGLTWSLRPKKVIQRPFALTRLRRLRPKIMTCSLWTLLVGFKTKST